MPIIDPFNPSPGQTPPYEQRGRHQDEQLSTGGGSLWLLGIIVAIVGLLAILVSL